MAAKSISAKPTDFDIKTMDRLGAIFRAIHRVATTQDDEMEDTATIGSIASAGHDIAEDWFRIREVKQCP